jgi:hypothetical protein
LIELHRFASVFFNAGTIAIRNSEIETPPRITAATREVSL